MQQTHRMATASHAVLHPSRHIARLCARTVLAGAIGHIFLSAGMATITALPMSAYATDAASVTLNTRKSFDIPPGPLESVLNRFGREAGVLISVQTDILGGFRSDGIKGIYNVREALPLLLNGTDLIGVIDGNAVIVQRKAGSSSSSVETTLPAVTVTTAFGSATEGTGAYAARKLSLGKGDQSLREIPQSITVMSRQRIEDQGLQNLADVFKNTTGVTTASRDNEAIGRIYARGFEIQDLQIDGSSFGPFSPQYLNPNLAMFDRVEVLRGADGLFSGGGTPGGSVNLVRKRPLADKQILVNASAGSWDRYRAELDATNALTEDGRIRGRAIIAKEERKGFIDHDWGRSDFLYGVLETDITPSTIVTVGANYEKAEKFALPPGLPRGLDGSDLRLPRSWNGSRYAWSTKDSEAKDVFAKLTHIFANDWELKMSVGYGERKQDNVTTGHLISAGIDPLTRIVNISGNGQNGFNNTPLTGYDSTYKNFDTNLQGSFSAFGQNHKFLVGADWAKFDTLEYTRRYKLGAAPGGAWSGPIDQLSQAPQVYPYPTLDNTRPVTEWFSSVEQYALYGRLNWSLTDKARIIGGARYAYYKSDSPTNQYAESGALTSRSTTRFEDRGVFTPYLGAIYDISQDWTAYGSVTEIYQSQANRRSGPLESAAALDPITGRNYEIGMKGEIANGKLMPAISLYRIERSGVAVLDPTYPAASLQDGQSCCYVASGEQVSEGIDLELTGQIARGLQIAAGYTYNKNKDKATNAIYHAVTPKQMFRLWTNYRLPEEYSAWSVGMGVNVQSKSYVSGTVFTFNQASGLFDGPTTRFNFTQGGYAVANAAVHYDINPKWRATLNINNLFDRHYYIALGALTGGNMYGDPRNVMLTLRGRF